MDYYDLPKVGIDLDGVLCNFNELMVNCINKVSGNKYLPKEVTSYDYTKCFDITEDQVIEAFKLCVDTNPDIWFNIGITNIMNIIAASELSLTTRLFAITKRREVNFNDPKKSTVNQSFSWLINKNIHVEGVIRVDFSKDKLQVVKDLGCQYFLDDHPDTFVTCLNEGVNIYLMDASYNQHIDAGDRRLKDVGEYLDIIRRDQNRKTKRH